MSRVWLICLALAGCAGTRPLQDPSDITQGPARLAAHAPKTVEMHEAWQTEVMLLGRASAFRDPLYLMIFTMEGQQGRFTVAPAVQRYYAFEMSPFTPHFYPQDGVVVMTVSLHRLRGFNFLGEAIPGDMWLYEMLPIRYTHSSYADRR